MNRTTNSFLKGMGAGVIAGAAMLTAGKMMLNSKSTKHALTKGTSSCGWRFCRGRSNPYEIGKRKHPAAKLGGELHICYDTT